MTGTRLILARHGNTVAPDEAPRRVGITDLALVARGREQAQMLGQHLRAQALLADRIITSGLQRTREMATHIQQQWPHPVPCTVDTFLNEIDYGVDENQPETAVRARLGEAALMNWERHALPPPGWSVDPQALRTGWHERAQRWATHHAGETLLILTSNGIARFAPSLTGDFAAFARANPLKLAPGAYGLLICETEGKAEKAPGWYCAGWNIRPARQQPSP